MRRMELTISMSRKVNLGNYESMDVFAAEKVELESTDAPEAVAPTMLAELREVLRKGLERVEEGRR